MSEMETNYIDVANRSRDEWEMLSVGSAVRIGAIAYASLRAHIRRYVSTGDIKTALTGVQIAGLNKAACIDLLMGREPEIQDAVPAGPQTPALSAVASVPVMDLKKGGNAVADAMAILAQAFGGNASEESIRKQVNELCEPHMQRLADVTMKADAFFDASEKRNQSMLDELRSEMLAGKPVRIEVVQKDGTLKDCGRQHFLFPLVLAVLNARCHPYLVGPAGSFKTSTAHAAANALGLQFYAISVCAQTTKTDLLGFFVPGTGAYCATDFRRAFELGGVFVCDEVDNGNANVLAVLNAALANSMMAFPDGMIARHPDFVLIACGNTYGQGADRLYVGRNQLDAATLDRFCFIDFPYDTGLEAVYCGIEGRPSPAFNIHEGGSVTADGWLDYVGRVRASAEKQKVRAVISTRASIYGVKLAEQGVGRKHLESLLIWKGLDEATAQKIKAALPK